MDKMIYTALNTMHNLYDLRALNSQNMANMSVAGFRRDLPNEGGTSYLMDGDKPTAKAFAMEMGPWTFSDKLGKMQLTEIKTDVALVEEGWFIIQPGEDAEFALSRRGDFSVDGDGYLVNGAGDYVLSNGLTPIEVPEYRDIKISQIGELLVNPLNAQENQWQSLGVIATTSAKGFELFKSSDGRIRPKGDEFPPVDQLAHMQQGMLESSNVNPIEEMVASMEMQREFELSVNFIESLKQLDESGVEIMRIAQD